MPTDTFYELLEFHVNLPRLPLILAGFLALDSEGHHEVRFGNRWDSIVDESNAEVLDQYGDLIGNWCREFGVQAAIAQMQDTLSNAVLVSEPVRICAPQSDLCLWADSLAQLVLP